MFIELVSALSLLCASSLNDQITAAFRLYDINNDGYITLEEMITYMSSVFRIMFESSLDMKEKAGVSADVLAQITTTQLFTDADIHHHDQLSFDEFKKVT